MKCSLTRYSSGSFAGYLPVINTVFNSRLRNVQVAAPTENFERARCLARSWFVRCLWSLARQLPASFSVAS